VFDNARDAAMPNASPTAANPNVRKKDATLQAGRRRSKRHPNSDFLHPLIYRIRNHSIDAIRRSCRGSQATEISPAIK
jgi:hypothetical protein